ncbi:M56 family metallopeptidase [Bremerella sp. JC817]|uniref:M56 family metallopeptidase n=1 Tax=Bremerella sp. JC817 TaxID=3231756 RepID=UPI00345B1DBE
MWSLLQSPLGMKLTLVLLHFLWQATLLFGFWRLAISLLCIRTPQARHSGALGTLLLIICCPVLTSCLIDSTSLPTAIDQNGIAATLIDSPKSASSDDLAGQALTSASSLTSNSSIKALSLGGWIVRSQPYLILGWSVGVLILGTRLFLGYIGTIWLRRSQLTPVESDLLVRFANLATRLNLLQLPPIAYSKRIGQAMTVGLLRPMVLLPAAWAASISPEILDAVFAHELAHIRRQDLWINFLQRLAETLFFYHPAVWWLSSEIRQTRESCCDELAVEALGQRLHYARSLQEVAHWQLEQPASSLATPFLGGPQQKLLDRVRHILGMATPPAGERCWAAGLLLASIPVWLWMLSAIFWPDSAPQALAKDRQSAIVELEDIEPEDAAPTSVSPEHAMRDHLEPHHHNLEQHAELHRRGHHHHHHDDAIDDVRQEDQEMLEVLKQLQQEVRSLRAEVEQLRQRPPLPPPAVQRRMMQQRPKVVPFWHQLAEGLDDE